MDSDQLKKAVASALKGDFSPLQALVDEGFDFNSLIDPPGIRLLHSLLDWQNKLEAIEWLLDHGSDPDLTVGPYAETALHVAVRRRRLPAVDLLLDRGADIDARTLGGKTAYAHALRRGFDEVADRLAERGADTSLEAADRLAVALTQGRLDEARSMIDADADLVPNFGPEEARILPDLAGRDRVEALTLLLDAGADLSARGLDGGTALHQAAWFGAPEAAKLLIARGAPLNLAGDDHQQPPLGWVAHGSRYSGGAKKRSGSYVRIAEMLLEAGASPAHPNHPDKDPHGEWLYYDASPQVAEVFRRFGVGRSKSD